MRLCLDTKAERKAVIDLAQRDEQGAVKHIALLKTLKQRSSEVQRAPGPQGLNLVEKLRMMKMRPG